MANSYEIAQMFAQQNSMFMGSNQFAQSLGVPSPPMFNQVGTGGQGVGATGFGAPRGPGGGFSWGQPGWSGYGPGNTISSGLMAGAGAAFTGGSMALGAASMFGMLGKAGAVMDPLAWGSRAFGMMGGGLAGGAAAAGAMALPVAAGLAIQHGVQSFVGGGQQQAQMNTMLGNQYQFFNPTSRTGAGFTRDDAKSIGDMTRSLSHLPEMMTSYEELTKVMGKLKSSGAMQGVRSAADFQARFREAITTIRDTAKILGTTMEEAEQFFTASRGAGFYGRGAQLKNVMAAQFTSGLTGATVGQVASMQQGGADMAMQFGARRGLGATAVTNIAQNIALAQREGRLREGAVEDVTGMQGPEAQLALSQRMFSGMMRFGQTAAGRLAMAGMMKYEGDRAVGVDEDMAKRFNQGLISVDELKARASRLTDKQKISYTARQSDLIASLAGQIGPGGAYGMMKSVLGEGRGEEATNLVMQRLTGMSAGEIDIAQGMQGVSGEGEQGQFARFRQRQAAHRERTDPSAVLQKVKTRLHAATFGKLEQLGANVQTSIAKTIDQFFDDVVGREVSTLTEDRAKAIAQAFSGSQSQEARDMLKSLTKLDSKGFAGPAGGGGGLAGLVTGRGTGSSLARVGLAGLAGGPGLGMITGGLQAAREFGGPESAMARLMANISGGQTAGQEREAIAKIFGTADLTKQGALADRLATGKIAGGGAQRAVAKILFSEEMTGKTESQRMQAVVGGLRDQVKDIIKKFPPGLRSEEDWAKLDDSTIENLAKDYKLSDDEKALMKSYSAASKNRVGGMNVYAQMAAASGMGANFAALLGGTGTLTEQKAELTKRQTAIADQAAKTIGAEATGMLASGNKKKRDMLKAAFQDKDLYQALSQQGNDTEVRLKLAAAGIDASARDISELRSAAAGFSKTGASVQEAMKTIEQYTEVANQLAGTEAREQIADTGAKLLANTQKGTQAGEAQKRVANALIAIGQKGYTKEAAEEYRAAFSAYSKTLGGLKGAELESALTAGGEAAQQAYGATRIAERFKDKSFKNVEEAAKALGVTAEDVAGVGFQSGKLSKDQLERLSTTGAATRQLIGGMGGGAGGAGGAKSEQQQMVDAIGQLNKNQAGIATLLATLSNDPDIKKKLTQVMSDMKETGSAGAGGKTNPGGAETK